MTAHDLAELVSAYFAERDLKRHRELRGVLADAVEEAGGDPSPLRTPQHVVYCVGNKYDAEYMRHHEETFFTHAEAAAFSAGDAHGDPNGDYSATFDSAEERQLEYPAREEEEAPACQDCGCTLKETEGERCASCEKGSDDVCGHCGRSRKDSGYATDGSDLCWDCMCEELPGCPGCDGPLVGGGEVCEDCEAKGVGS